jgi:hypothetical protein
LPLKPAIVLKPIKTAEAKGGSIDRRDPHSINNVLIDFFGNLEIIIVACDDGDVIGYYTHKIEDAINRLSLEEEEEDLSFFAKNVQKSAWGLSIHTKSRKIAISANTESVTIFASGLVCDNDLPRPLPDDKLEWHKAVLKDPKWRADEQRFVIGKWGNNIPSVAFCNNDEDNEGRLLAFGDIENNIHILDIHKLKNVELIRVGFCCQNQKEKGSECHCSEDNYPHASWGLAWLDRKSFHVVARQLSPYHDYPARRAFAAAWDGSSKKFVIPDANSRSQLLGLWPTKAPDNSPSSNRSPNSSSSTFSSPRRYEDDDEDAYSSGIESTWSEKGPKTPMKKNMSKARNGDDICDDQDLRWQSENYTFGIRSLFLSTQNMDGDDKPAMPSPRMTPAPNFNYRDANYPCPLFVTSKADACLLQPKDHLNRVTPVIGYQDPLEQWAVMHMNKPFPWFHHDQAMDRLSLQAHIPELGALIIGTPKGRVGVFTLCQSLEKTDGSPIYFHRLDWILPFESQESNDERPLSKLIGIAVGPVQGHLQVWDGVKNRKWRLILHYNDHTLLSYEITKEDEEVVWKDGARAGLYRTWRQQNE